MTLKAPRAGEPISSSQWLQPVADELNKHAGTENLDRRPPAGAPSAGSAPLSARFVSEQANTITVEVDGTGELLEVAKPPTLRGHIATRVNLDGATEEIFPPYHAAYKMLVIEVTDTGVAGVTWADISWDARRWAIEVS